MYKTLGKTPRYTHTFKKTCEIGADCTIAEAIEIELDYLFFSKILEEEIDRFYNMFVQKNDIFPPNSEADNEGDHEKLTKEDILLYDGIKKQTRTLQISEREE